MQPLHDTTLADKTDAEAVAACNPLLRQLRPDLSGPEELVARWRRQAGAGYRLILLLHKDRPTALTGFRVQENLVHGRHLYVDDLVTDAAARSGVSAARSCRTSSGSHARMGAQSSCSIRRSPTCSATACIIARGSSPARSASTSWSTSPDGRPARSAPPARDP